MTDGDPDDDPLFVDKNNFATLDQAKARNDVIMGEILKVIWVIGGSAVCVCFLRLFLCFEDFFFFIRSTCKLEILYD